MERLSAWSLSFVSSFVVALTLTDDFQLGHDSTMGNQIDIVFGVACASMVVSLLFIISNIACAAKIIGGYVELGTLRVACRLGSCTTSTTKEHHPLFIGYDAGF